MTNRNPTVPPPPGPNFARRIPDGDTHARYVCGDCGHIAYTNPKIVTGAVVTYEGRLLLCRRAIEPRLGFWTIPAGYLEEHETPAQGARREAQEEAGCEIVIDALLAVYALSHISQVQLIYRAALASPQFAPGPESLETALLAYDDIPWDLLAFPSVAWALKAHRAVDGLPVFAPFANPV